MNFIQIAIGHDSFYDWRSGFPINCEVDVSRLTSPGAGPVLPASTAERLMVRP
jgi:hypothetical protein